MSMRTPIDDDRVAELTRDGWTARDIAAELGYTARTVVRARVRTGTVGPTPRRYTDEEIELCERLFDDGCSLSEVARTIGRAAATVWERFPHRGWTREQCSEFAALSRGARGIL